MGCATRYLSNGQPRMVGDASSASFRSAGFGWIRSCLAADVRRCHCRVGLVSFALDYWSPPYSSGNDRSEWGLGGTSSAAGDLGVVYLSWRDRASPAKYAGD